MGEYVVVRVPDERTVAGAPRWCGPVLAARVRLMVDGVEQLGLLRGPAARTNVGDGRPRRSGLPC
jgi:hypothetical protein